MEKEDPDYVCVQELKAQAPDMTDEFLTPHGFHGHFHYAEKKATPVRVCIARRSLMPYTLVLAVRSLILKAATCAAILVIYR